MSTTLYSHLSRDRTFRTLFRTVPDIPDIFSDTIPDTFGQHTGQSTGHHRTLYRTVPDMIGQDHVRLCPKCPVQTGHVSDTFEHISDTFRTCFGQTFVISYRVVPV